MHHLLCCCFMSEQAVMYSGSMTLKLDMKEAETNCTQVEVLSLKCVSSNSHAVTTTVL